jgi:hypothetical protein
MENFIGIKTHTKVCWFCKIDRRVVQTESRLSNDRYLKVTVENIFLLNLKSRYNRKILGSLFLLPPQIQAHLKWTHLDVLQCRWLACRRFIVFATNIGSSLLYSVLWPDTLPREIAIGRFRPNLVLIGWLFQVSRCVFRYYFKELFLDSLQGSLRLFYEPKKKIISHPAPNTDTFGYYDGCIVVESWNAQHVEVEFHPRSSGSIKPVGKEI